MMGSRCLVSFINPTLQLEGQLATRRAIHSPGPVHMAWGPWSRHDPHVSLLTHGHSIPQPELGNCPASWQKFIAGPWMRDTVWM